MVEEKSQRLRLGGPVGTDGEEAISSSSGIVLPLFEITGIGVLGGEGQAVGQQVSGNHLECFRRSVCSGTVLLF